MYSIPEINRSGWLKVSDMHEVYWEESGNPVGIPVIFVHGGPGAGTAPICRGFFNPDRYRIVLIDQRGCGQSRPYAETRENTTWDLVADLEKLRESLGIERWLVFGGSWGSTLSLAYAQSHPERVLGLILRGIFLCRQSEINWLNEKGGVSQIYPAHWQRYLAPIAPEKRGGLVQAYHELLFGDDQQAAVQAAKAWNEWESYLIRFEPQEQDLDGEESLAIARLENHYFVNLGWLAGEKVLLSNIDTIRHIPAVIVQGRYDLCTPMQSAWELSQAWPEAELRIVQAGHASTEEPLASALTAAADEFADRLAL